jgi:hypothetical protein
LQRTVIVPASRASGVLMARGCDSLRSNAASICRIFDRSFRRRFGLTPTAARGK